MKKNFKFYVIAWAILLAIFNIIVFIIPNEAAGMTKFGGAFWAGYGFITLAFIGQLICAYFAFKADDIKKLFFNLPLVTISYSALIISIILGALCMAIPNLPNWAGVIACVLILGFHAIAVIKAKAAAEIAIETGNKVKDKTLFIKSLTIDAESLLAHAKSETAKSAAKKVYEAIRYSDPMSNDALADIESQITQSFRAFSNAITSESDDVSALAEKILILIENRNTKCRLSK